MKHKKGSAYLREAFKLAVSEHQKKHFATAEKLYRDILKNDTQHVDATYNLGVLLSSQGRYKESLPLLQAALQMAPPPPQPEHWLTYVSTLHASGQTRAALATLRQLREKGLQNEVIDKLELKILKNYPEIDISLLKELEQKKDYCTLERVTKAWLKRSENNAQLQLFAVSSLANQNKPDEALPILEAVCQAHPTSAQIWQQLGTILKRLGRAEEAYQAYQEALQLEPNSIPIYRSIISFFDENRRYHEMSEWADKGLAIEQQSPPLRASKASALLKLGCFNEGLELTNKLLSEGDRSYATLLAHALLLRNKGYSEDALAFADELLQQHPTDANALSAKGQILNDLGQFKEAQELIYQALEHLPDAIEIWSLIPVSRKMTPQDKAWVNKAEALLQQKQYPPLSIATLKYSMGKFYDDTKNYPAAFANYQEANSLRRKYSGNIYDRNNQVKLTQALIDAYTPEYIQKAKKAETSPSALPVLIVGMPRSGTSLTEQILASHPAITGAGELDFWLVQVHNFKVPCLSANLPEDWLQKTATAYLDLLHSKSGNSALRVVDKMPGNFLWLGAIYTAFPNARILHTVRNPIDTCLSIYFQNFHSGHAYSHDLEDIAFQYRLYHRLMHHWHQALPPDRLLMVAYEEIVEDHAGWSKKIIDFIGLDWNESCLNFHETERRIGTASNWQAHQPIYKTSKERWRNYEGFIEPLLPLLELSW